MTPTECCNRNLYRKWAKMKPCSTYLLPNADISHLGTSIGVKETCKIVCERHIVIYLNVSATVAFRNTFLRKHSLPMNCSDLSGLPPPHTYQKHFIFVIAGEETILFCRRTRNGKGD